MISTFAVDQIWVPTLFQEFGASPSTRWNLGGCENHRVSERARKAISDPAMEWLRDHWLAQDQSLRVDLATFHNVAPEQVFLTSGAIGGIRYAFEVFTRPGSRVGYMCPEWPGFRYFAEHARTAIRQLERPEFPFTATPQDLIDFVHTEQLEFVILSNPSAVTGVLWEPDQIAEVLSTCPDTLFVIDEADSIYPQLSAAHLAAHHHNGVFLGSFSKFYALSGLRIGYLVTPPAYVEQLANTVNPAELASVAIVAAREVFNDSAFHEQTQTTVQHNLLTLQAAVAAGPFHLVEGSRCFATYLWSAPEAEDPVAYLASRGIDLIPGRVFGLTRGGRLNLSNPDAIAALVAALPR